MKKILTLLTAALAIVAFTATPTIASDLEASPPAEIGTPIADTFLPEICAAPVDSLDVKPDRFDLIDTCQNSVHMNDCGVSFHRANYKGYSKVFDEPARSRIPAVINTMTCSALIDHLPTDLNVKLTRDFRSADYD